MEEVTMYKCSDCGQSFDEKYDAHRCEFIHARETYANALLQDGRPLSTINYLCGFGWHLTKQQEDITKDNCFIVSYWQCCDKPVYTITHISGTGWLKLWGCGSWSGWYGEDVPLSRLPEPHPKEELFVDQIYFKR